MRRLLPTSVAIGMLTLLAGVVASAARADDKEDAGRQELKKLQGTWVLVAAEREGEKIPDEQVKKGRITWKGAVVIVDTPHQSAEKIKATTMLDPTTNPKKMDWVRSQGPGSGQTHHAIYEFLSADEYRVCFAPPGKDRPKEFRTRPGTGEMMHTWKRVKGSRSEKSQ